MAWYIWLITCLGYIWVGSLVAIIDARMLRRYGGLKDGSSVTTVFIIFIWPLCFIVWPIIISVKEIKKMYNEGIR